MDRDVFARLLKRPPDGHKYRYGHVLVVGGSPGMTGAPLLAGMAALRTGAGLVTIAAAPEVADKLERRVKEIMTLAFTAPDTLEDFIRERKVSAIVAGPGLRPTDETAALARNLSKTGVPVILDGGALQAGLDVSGASAAVILTPHTGEFKRLLGRELPEKRAELKPLAARFAEAQHAIVVLKGEPTYVARPGGHVYENSTGNPGLATAGTGDVLGGVITGLVAQHVGPAEAAEAGVYLHGLAGDIAAAEKTQPGMIAGDVIEALPAALRRAGNAA